MMIEVYDINIPELDMYVSANENQLRHYYEPEPGVFIAESPNVIMRALDAGYEPISFLSEKEIESDTLEKRILEYDVPHFVADATVLKELRGYPMTRGALCAMRRKTMISATDVIRDAKRIAVLEDVMNPTNLGAIFRSAAALNMDAVLLTPGCSDPLYRRAARVSMGCVFQIPWTYLDEKEVDWLHENGFKTVAMALKDDSISIDDRKLMEEEKLAIIMGTEAFGLAQETIDKSDYTVMIPMAHGVDSLNVAAASAIAFWQLGRK